MSNYQNNLNNMMCMDVFVMGLSPQEYRDAKLSIQASKNQNNVLMCHDIVAMDMANTLVNCKSDEFYLKKYAKELKWQENIKKILNNPFKAIILTDVEKQILWVNNGFVEMTGFKEREAIGRSPSFLQGKNTDQDIQQLFRRKLKEDRNFSLSIKNYRKNGEEYECKVDIFPLHNENDQISHFLALEQEIF
jgi:PAS domain S-box-containing protein